MRSRSSSVARSLTGTSPPLEPAEPHPARPRRLLSSVRARPGRSQGRPRLLLEPRLRPPAAGSSDRQHNQRRKTSSSVSGDPIDIDQIEPDFGHWFAGLVAGEGCFCITTRGRRPTLQCRFVLSLRADDAPILRECIGRLGIGNLSERRQRTGARPYTRWQVGDKAGVLFLVRLFERFPLRAKKAQDFEIWKLAVLEWHRCAKGPGRAADWRHLDELAHRLVASRRFAEVAE